MSQGDNQRSMQDIYAARLRGDLEGLCRQFSATANFRLAGSGQTIPLAVSRSGAGEIRSLLRLLIKSFQLTDLTILAMLVDGSRAATHWSAKVHSRITGGTAETELMDLVEFKDGLVVDYLEFFVPS